MNFRKQKSIFRNIYEQPFHGANRISLYNSAKGSLDLVQRLGLLRNLPIHNGCVNCICWSDNGDLLLSGSDDQHLVVSHAYTYKTITDYKTSHRANIFSAKFLPCSSDKNIISCSGDGIILFTDLIRPSDTHNCKFNCHVGTTYEVATIPGDPHTFLSCGEDYTVRCFDLRIKESCNKPDCKEDVLICCQRAVTALTINNMVPHQLAVGCSDSTVRIFDRRMMGTVSSGSCRNVRPLLAVCAPGLEGKSYRITSLAFSPEGQDILVSYSSEHLYLFSTLYQNDFQTFKQDNYSGDDENGDNCIDLDGIKPVVGLPPIRRLRLRGDWSDTGPDARPEREPGRSGDVAQARPTLHATLMQRMTDVLSRMLNDPATRAALSHGGEDETEQLNNNLNVDSASASGQNDFENPDNANDETEDNEQDLIQEPEFVDLNQVDQVIENSINDPQIEVSLLSVDIVTQTVNDNSQQQISAPGTEQSSESASDNAPTVQDSNRNVTESIQTADPIWSPEPDIQDVSAVGTSETVLLPSFESTYSSYSLVKSPAVSQSPTPNPKLSPERVSSSSTHLSSADVNDETTHSQSQSTSPGPSSPPVMASASNSSNSSNTSDRSLRSLTDQLSNMRHGFIEKHGTEPMVNLHYSDKGSTASRITMSVADEVNREQVDNNISNNISNYSSSQVEGSSETPGSSGGVSDFNVSCLSNNNEALSQTTSDKFNPETWLATTPSASVEAMSEDEDSIILSDDESDRATSLPITSQESTLDDPVLGQCNISAMYANSSQKELAKDAKVPTLSSISMSTQNDKVKLKQIPVKQKYTGHRNARTMIKEATFWGNDYVLSGSDCGHVFVWNRNSARLVMLLEADHHVVNCIQPHPQLPLLATSGIDYDVKLWAPIYEQPAFDPEMADELMKRNEVMLEETKDTITVPASFMIRMLACLNEIRRRRSRTRPGTRPGSSGEGTSNNSD